MNEETETLVVAKRDEGKRLDQILTDHYSNVNSRTYFQNLIRERHVLLNGQPIKKRVKPSEGDKIEVFFALTPEMDLISENIPLNIIYEDETILVVNKPAGMVVHPAPGNWSGTFVNALLFHCRSLRQMNETLRPGIVHRLDKDTSGILVAAKTPVAQQRLMESFAKREVCKEYLAVCLGNPGEGEFSYPIGRHPVHRQKMAVQENGGRPAKTFYKTLVCNDKLSVVSIVIETGRTHQIRVHLSYNKTPVLGDPVYGNSQANKKYQANRQMLHARRLFFHHPITGKQMDFVAEIPLDMKKYLPPNLK